MADYRLSAQVIGRSSGRSATAAAAYRSATRIVDDRTGLVHDYTRKQGVLHSEIIAPVNAPDWMHDRSQLWNAVEAAERRKDSQLAREIQLSLPHEFTTEQSANLLRSFCGEQFVDRGMIADICMHAPSSHEQADSRNFHAHVMLTTRELMGDGFGDKEREWNNKDVLEEWREQWANHQNRELKRLGFAFRVSHQTLEEQGIAREPQKHLGVIASEIERDGRQSHRGRENDEIRRRNQIIDDLEKSDNLLDAKIVFEKRKFDVWAERKEEKLQLDQSKRDAQFQVGLAARMMEFENQLNTEFAETKDGLSKSHNEVSTRLDVRGWRKFVRDITLTTRDDKRELERVERELETLRKAEEAKRAEQERLEAQRQQNITKDAERKAALLKAGVEKARARREASDWMPKPQIREQVPTDWKDASNKPLVSEFEDAANRSHKPVERVDTDSGGSGAGDPFADKRAAAIRRQDALKNPKDHIGRAIARHDEEQEHQKRAAERAAVRAEELRQTAEAEKLAVDDKEAARAAYIADQKLETSVGKPPYHDLEGDKAQQPANDDKEAARAAYIAEQRSQETEPPKDRAAYVKEQQETEIRKEPYHRKYDRD